MSAKADCLFSNCRYLLVSPKERKVVVVENVFGRSLVRNNLARALFCHFEVLNVLFVPSHLMALTTLAVTNGVVVDMGYSETTVVPIFSGVQILQAFQDQNFGGRALNEEVKRQLKKHNLIPLLNGVERELTEIILEDIKVRTCFVTKMERAKLYQQDKSVRNELLQIPPTVEYPIKEAETAIQIPGQLRETIYEILFEENNDRDSLPHLILKAILACPVDTRRCLMENICLVGGSAIVMGLTARLKDELLYLIANDPLYKDKFHGEINFKFHKTLRRPNIAAWQGASLCGATDFINSRSINKEDYVKMGLRLPEWVSLDDYQRHSG